MLKKIKSAFSLWNIVRGADTSSLVRLAALPVSLAVIGEQASFEQLCSRLGSAADAVRIHHGQPIEDREGQIILDAVKLIDLSSADFNRALSAIVIRHAERRIALAAKFPAFRVPVANMLSHERAVENARTAAISALPGVIPLTDWLLPAAAAGDIYVLTNNQILLLLEVATCYGRSPDAKARIKELLPVIGSAFGWRAVARELLGVVPGGVGGAGKAVVAYAGTYSIGRAASYYYSGGTAAVTKEKLRSIYRAALADGIVRAKEFLARK